MLVDASVALKWYLAESDSSAAEALFEQHALAAPDLILAEVGNGLWKAWRKDAMSADAYAGSLDNLADRFELLYPLAPLLSRAAEIGRTLNHPIYDCLYLACAERQDKMLVTADLRLLKVVAGSAWEPRCRPLSEEN